MKHDEINLIAPDRFCRRNGIRRTTFYRLLETGELSAIKLGRRTFIRSDEEARWLASLPNYQPLGCQS